MNKQVIIAGLLGAINAQTACDDAFVRDATQELEDLNREKVDIDAETAGLQSVVDADQADFDAADAKLVAAQGVLSPFTLALATATANHKTQNDAVTAANAAINALDVATTGPIAAATAATGAADGLVNAKNAEIAIVVTNNGKMTTAKTELDAEVLLLTGILATQTQAETDAIAAYDAAVAAKRDLQITKISINGAAVTQAHFDAQSITGTLPTDVKTVDGVDKLVADATSAKETADLAVETVGSPNTGKTIELTTAYDLYKVEQAAFDLKTKYKATITEACAYAGGFNCVPQANDPIQAMADGNAPSPASSTNYDTAASSLGEYKAIAANKAWLLEQATANQTTADSAIITATGEVTTTQGANTTATTNKGTANTNKTTADTQLAQAVLDLGRGTDLLATMNGELAVLVADASVKAYLQKIQDDARVAEVAAKAAANLNLADLLALKTQAQITVTRATESVTFNQGLVDEIYKTVLDGACTVTLANDCMVPDLSTPLAISRAMRDKNAVDIAGYAAAIVKAEAALAGATAQCKTMGYEKAQAAKKDFNDQVAADAAAAETVKADYDAKSAFSTSGEANTLCNYPPKTADGAQEPRVNECKDGFCCGAAQKFLKDGTKLALETCQKSMGVHTYTYYPPLPEGAAVEPATETWRFQCISGAQKLAAAATAALAASYMMA